MVMQVQTIHNLPTQSIAQFCQRWQVCELALFGSSLYDEWEAAGDVTVLVNFQPDPFHPDEFLSNSQREQMQAELAEILGRSVLLVTKEAIEQSENYIRRQRILSTATVIYQAGCCAPDTAAELTDFSSEEEQDIALLLDMLIACQRIRRYTADLSWMTVERDCTLQDAIVRQLEIIGESAKRMSPSAKKTYRDIPWALILETEARLLDESPSVDMQLVWDVVQKGIPKLQERIQRLIPPERGMEDGEGIR